MTTRPARWTLHDYQPGALAEVVRLHMDYYGPQWGFGLPFETKVAGEMAEFLARHDPALDLFLCAAGADGRMLGSITLDGSRPDAGLAHLRWFIVDAALRGHGLGRGVLRRAVGFAEALGFDGIYLTTFAELHAAVHLYRSAGFVLVRETPYDDWGGDVGEQRFELHFDRSGG